MLIGQASSPIPKGPIKIGAKPVSIDFRNPFFEAADFVIRIDNPSFTTGTKSPIKIEVILLSKVKLCRKKTISIPITYKAVPGSSTTGRLMISTGKNLRRLSDFLGDYPPWIYYLQAE